MSLKFLAGIAVGAVVVHFLKTEEGKAFLWRLKTDIGKTGEELACIADGLVERGRRIVGGAGMETEPEEESLIVVVESNPVV